MPSRLSPITVLCASVLLGGPAGAFSIGSGFSEPCHEKVTGKAYKDFLLDVPQTDIVLPADAGWSLLSEFLLGQFPPKLMEELDEVQRFLLTSLVVGVRAPDTEGHSVLNFASLRQLHSDPDPIGQYAHALRAPGDDDVFGDIAVVEGTRAVILDLVEEARLAGLRPPAQRLLPATVYLDFYGEVTVDVWAPAYYVGRAAHALQDSFAHMLRSDSSGLTRVVHAMNFVEAIQYSFDESVDGLAHSASMDDCLHEEVSSEDGTFDAAVHATIDLFTGVRAVLDGVDPEGVVHVLDKWLELDEGCSLSDDFCGNSRWLEVAREHQTGPYIEEFLGCAAGSEGGLAPGAAMLLGLLLLVALRRASFTARAGPRPSCEGRPPRGRWPGSASAGRGRPP